MIKFFVLLKKLKALAVISFGAYLNLTRMLPAWQSAWTKLYFINIEKKAFAPKFAITLFKLCSLLS